MTAAGDDGAGLANRPTLWATRHPAQPPITRPTIAPIGPKNCPMETNTNPTRQKPTKPAAMPNIIQRICCQLNAVEPNPAPRHAQTNIGTDVHPSTNTKIGVKISGIVCDASMTANMS